MSWSSFSTFRPAWVMAVVLASSSTGPVASAQQMPGATEKSPIKEPVASRVYQRGINGRAEIPIVLDESAKGWQVASVQIGGNVDASALRYADGKLTGVPVGGPYMVTCLLQKDNANQSFTVGPVFVGDLWVLAGQSNMEGVGDLVDVTPPSPGVMMLGMDGRWRQAEEPLHWLVDSPDPVHSGDPKDRAERSAATHRTRTKGAGLGLPFAEALTRSTGVPIGLVICAHGGTSMEQWNPEKKGDGENSLYGSMMRQFQLAGGKVKGVLWYQGESDAMGGDAWKRYPQVFARFIEAVRSDFGQPDLPFYYVQIGRFVTGANPQGWNAVQEAQRALPDRVPYTAVISVIDLELDDAIHVGTQGLKRAGQRLARIAERELFGQLGATTPTLDRVARGPNNTLVVKFKGVNMAATGPRPAVMRPGPSGSMMSGFPGPGASSMGPGPGPVPPGSAGEVTRLGLMPERHIAGFSIRKSDGGEIPLIYEAYVGKARDTVVLKLAGPIPAGAQLWYGYGLDPYCNLTDSMDMAVPVFGPVPLDELAGSGPASASAPARPRAEARTAGQAKSGPIRALVITGDNVGAHAWKETSNALKEILEKGGRIKVDITATPSKDLTDENLARYDVLILNYKETPGGSPESRWSEANKKAFLKAVRGGKGLASYHFGSSAFAKPNWVEFEKAVAGGWRSQGFHGPAHAFTVKKTDAKHPISEGAPASFDHVVDELYQNSMLTPGSVVLATAYSDPKKPRGTGKDEPVIWVNHYGQGRVYENVLGHNTSAMADPNYQEWLRRGVIWAATSEVK
ncbi:MAG: sialate O-acetylesterase [Isosphaeraceae bacterium]